MLILDRDQNPTMINPLTPPKKRKKKKEKNAHKRRK